MVTCNMAQTTLDASSNSDITVSYAADIEVTEIKAFILAPDTFAPLQNAWCYQI